MRPEEAEHFAEIADGDGGSAGCHQHADQFDDFAGPGEQGGVADLADIGAQIEGDGRCVGWSWDASCSRLQFVDQPRSISRSWVSTEASSAPRLISKKAPPADWAGSADDFDCLPRPAAAGSGAPVSPVGMNADAIDFLLAQLFERGLDERFESGGIDGQFTVQHAARDLDGEPDGIGFGAADGLCDPEIRRRWSRPVSRRRRGIRFEFLARRGFSVAETLFGGGARFLFDSESQLVDLGAQAGRVTGASGAFRRAGRPARGCKPVLSAARAEPAISSSGGESRTLHDIFIVTTAAGCDARPPSATGE